VLLDPQSDITCDLNGHMEKQEMEMETEMEMES